jgi:hypothetical protein
MQPIPRVNYLAFAVHYPLPWPILPRAVSLKLAFRKVAPRNFVPCLPW